MKVLVACEFSGVVRDAFAARHVICSSILVRWNCGCNGRAMGPHLMTDAEAETSNEFLKRQGLIGIPLPAQMNADGWVMQCDDCKVLCHFDHMSRERSLQAAKRAGWTLYLPHATHDGDFCPGCTAKRVPFKLAPEEKQAVDAFLKASR